jgi:hypothetical protein
MREFGILDLRFAIEEARNAYFGIAETNGFLTADKRGFFLMSELCDI